VRDAFMGTLKTGSKMTYGNMSTLKLNGYQDAGVDIMFSGTKRAMNSIIPPYLP